MALPNGYTQLRYIQSSGTQYINTRYKPSGNALRVVMKFRYTAAYSGLSLFGNHTSTPYSLTVYGARPTFWVGNSSDVSCGPQTELNVDYTLDVTAENGTITAIWNGIEYTATYSGDLYTEQPIFIFGGNSNGALAEAGNGYQLEMYQLYDGGVLVRDYVPAKSSAGVVGLYDNVEGVLDPNAGSGAFTEGPSITGPVDGEGAVILAGVSFAIKEGTAMLNGVARKITEGMTILNGAAKKIAVASGIDVAALVIGYTGAYTDQPEVTMSGKKYRLLTLTGSGTLTVDAEVKADVWMCGGGAGGAGGDSAVGNSVCGGAGAYTASENNIALQQSVVAVIGAGSAGVSTSSPIEASATSFGGIKTKTVKGKNGGTGAGGGDRTYAPAGTGDGIDKHPFLDSTAFPDPCCGGGGGGHGTDNESDDEWAGGNGGTNGGNGSTNGSERGGVKGGGNGGVGSYGSGSAATYYGSGGGAGAFYCTNKGSVRGGTGGAGYQGVIYVRIPYEQ